MSHCHYVTLSHCHTVTMSHCHTVILSHIYNLFFSDGENKKVDWGKEVDTVIFEEVNKLLNGKRKS